MDFKTFLFVLLTGIFSMTVCHDCNKKVRGGSDREDFWLDVIQEQQEARKCAEIKLKKIEQGDGVCYKFLLTGGDMNSFSISASSTHSDCRNTSNYLLNAKERDLKLGNAGAWCVGSTKSMNFVQISFADFHSIQGVATQGRDPKYAQRVTKYKVFFSTDCLNFQSNGKEYAGNFDQEAVVVHLFDPPVKAKCIRINPTKYHNHMSMRFDVIGCKIRV